MANFLPVFIAVVVANLLTGAAGFFLIPQAAAGAREAWPPAQDRREKADPDRRLHA